MHNIKRILVVSRWTRECKKALHHGISLARSYNAELSILHTIQDTFELSGSAVYVPRLADLEEGYRNLVGEVKQEFKTMIEAEQAKGMTIKETIKDGHPAAEILKAISDGKIDLVIMAHHQEDRIEHYLFCRDYEKVIRKMPCSIMLVQTEPWKEEDKKASRRGRFNASSHF
jgi:nucleotide-binding universal stress UspA family protein